MCSYFKTQDTDLGFATNHGNSMIIILRLFVAIWCLSIAVSMIWTQVVYIYMSNLTLAENKIAETKFVFKMRIVSKLVNKSWKLQENFLPAICHYSSKNSTFKIRNVGYWNNKRLIKIEERIFLFKIRIVGLEFCWYMKVCFNLNYFY